MGACAASLNRQIQHGRDVTLPSWYPTLGPEIVFSTESIMTQKSFSLSVLLNIITKHGVNGGAVLSVLQ